MNMLKEIRITDKYNPKKIWLVRYYGCGHYFYNQEIAGKKFYKRYSKTTRKHLISIGLEI